MKFWDLWANALGQKASREKKEADKIAILRTFIVLQAIITNVFIVWNILRNWQYLKVIRDLFGYRRYYSYIDVY